MVIVYICLFCLPLLMIFLVFCAIAAAGMKTGRTGKRMYDELKPYINDISEKAERVQQKGLDFNQRANNLEKTFQEIAGRWAFITRYVREARNSPLVKLAGVAGRLTGRG